MFDTKTDQYVLLEVQYTAVDRISNDTTLLYPGTLTVLRNGIVVDCVFENGRDKPFTYSAAFHGDKAKELAALAVHLLMGGLDEVHEPPSWWDAWCTEVRLSETQPRLPIPVPESLRN